MRGCSCRRVEDCIVVTYAIKEESRQKKRKKEVSNSGMKEGRKFNRMKRRQHCTAPLAQLTILTPCLHLAMVTSSMRLLVSFVSGVCTVMKSLFAQMSSKSALSMPTCNGEGVRGIDRG